jgi:hypothetical protein
MGSMELLVRRYQRGAYYPDRPLADRRRCLANRLGLPQGARIAAAFLDRPGRREAAGHRSTAARRVSEW